MCGCVKNKSKQYTSKSVLKKNNKNDNSCKPMYNKLIELYEKALKVLEQENDEVLQQANKQLRVWIRELDKHCPNDFELTIVEQYVNNEYTKHIS